MDEATMETLVVALTPLAIAVASLLLQRARKEDTEKHGDAFIAMLKGAYDTLDKVASVLPQAKTAVEGYKATVDEAERIWNSAGLTADDVKTIQNQALFWKLQIDLAVAKYRALKSPEQAMPEPG